MGAATVVVVVAVERNNDDDVFCRAVAAVLMKREFSRVVIVAVQVCCGDCNQGVVVELISSLYCKWLSYIVHDTTLACSAVLYDGDRLSTRFKG